MRNDSSMAAAALLAVATLSRDETILDIALDRQVGKKRQVLKHVAHSAKLRRNIDSERAVEQDLFGCDLGCDSARIRPDQPGYAIQQSSLPCPRRTKQDRDSGRERDGEVKFEIFSRRRLRIWRDTP